MRQDWLFGGVVVAIGAILASVGAVQAGFDEGMINVSFGGKDATPVGKAVVGSEGDQWNAPEGREGRAIALSDVKGASTDVRLTFDADRTYDAVHDSPFLGGPNENLLRHYLVAVQERQLALEGLTPGTRYSLYLYSASNPGGDNRVTKFTVGAQTKLTTFSMEKKEFTPGVNYTRFTVAAGSDGKVSLTYSGGEGPEGNLNGLQILPAKGAAATAGDTPPKGRAATPARGPASNRMSSRASRPARSPGRKSALERRNSDRRARGGVAWLARSESGREIARHGPAQRVARRWSVAAVEARQCRPGLRQRGRQRGHGLHVRRRQE